MSVAATKEYQAAWQRANPEKVAAQQRRYYEKNLEKRRAAGRERNAQRRLDDPEYDLQVARRYREAHPDRFAASTKKYAATHRIEIARRSMEWRRANPEKAKAADLRKQEKNPQRNAEMYAKNKEKMTAAAKQWRKDNPDGAREIDRKNKHARRARKALSAEQYTLSEIRELRQRIGGKCAICGVKGRMTIDHIVALANSGSNGIKNIQFLCGPCNSRKQAKDPIRFAQENGLLL